MTRFSPEGLDAVERHHRRWRFRQASHLSERYVPGEGCDTGKPIAIIIGEAPGAQEDLKLRPFVGDSGLVLRELMASIGLFTGYTPHFGQSNVWLTNVVKFRPPGNRTPDEAMIEGVRHLLRKEWNAIGRPKVVIPVGGVALHAVLGYKASILAMAGELHTFTSRTTGDVHYVWPQVHPSFAMRSENAKQLQPLLERDWQVMGEWLRATEEYLSG